MTGLIWRQHRGQALWTVISVTALCALMVSFGLSAEHWLAAYHLWLKPNSYRQRGLTKRYKTAAHHTWVLAV